MNRLLRKFLRKRNGKRNSAGMPQFGGESKVYDNRLLQDKKILITGAAGVIGRAISAEVAAQGARPVCVDIDEPKLDELRAAFAEAKKEAEFVVLDITNHDRVRKFLDDRNDTIDVVINNAGITADMFKFLEFSGWQKTFDVNVFGAVFLTQQCVKRMIERSVAGNILFITSLHQWTVHRAPAYSASKAALGLLIKEMAAEFSAYGIRVNGIAPGWVTAAEDVYYKHALLHNRPIEPEYIGRAAVFLTSEYFSRCTTGIVLPVDSGAMLFNHRIDQSPPKRGT